MSQSLCSRIDRVVARLFRNCRTVSVTEVASELELSRYQLTRRFAAETGRRLSNYLRERQLQRARELLRTTTLPVKRIALLSGCGSERTLRRIFSEMTRSSPTEWRGRG